MANEQHFDILKQGINAWNQWRKNNLEISPNLSGVDLSEANLENANFIETNLSKTNFKGANLKKANLTEANLIGANLEEADLHAAIFNTAILSTANLSEANITWAQLINADLSGANLNKANLSKADLSTANLFRTYINRADLIQTNFTRAILIEADLTGANLDNANFTEANLTHANLISAQLIETNFEKAILTSSHVYGISTWNLKLDGANQKDLIITPPEEPVITIDNLEVAQFIYLMLHNEKIRDVINTIGRKGVLILGRFTPTDRKAVLDAIREKLRQLDYVPIVFDFERPTDRDFTETIMTLAGMCHFIIADITNPKSSPLELQATVPNYMIPFVPILHEGEKPFAMFKDLQIKYRWILDVLVYHSVSNLIEGFEKEVIKPALEKHDQLIEEKAGVLRERHI